MSRNFDRSALDPNQIAVHGFGSGFRGYDQDEVRAYLQRLAGVMQELLDGQADLARRLEEAEERAARPPELDEDQLTAALGAETARVLSSARQAATDIRVNAEKAAERVVVEATQEAAAIRAGADEYGDGVRRAADEQQGLVRDASERVRADADEHASTTRDAADEYARTVRAEAEADAGVTRGSADEYAQGVRSEVDQAVAAERAEASRWATQVAADADATAAALKAEAETDAGRLRADAEQILSVRAAEAEEEVERIRAAAAGVEAEADQQADATREAAREEGRQMIVEAQQVRERMLKDLARRRKGARQQLEQLGAARERLLEAYAVVRQTVEDATSELLIALPEARFAAERAGRRARGEAEATLEELEAEIDAARETGVLGDAVTAPEPDAEIEPASGDGDTDSEALGPVRIVGAQVAGSVDPSAAERRAEASPPVGAVGAVGVGAVSVGGVASDPPAAVDPPVVDGESSSPQPDSAGMAQGGLEPAGGRSEADDNEPDVKSLFDRIRAGRAESDPAASTIDEHDGPTEVGGAAEPAVDGTAVEAGPVAMLSLFERRDSFTEAVDHRLARKLKRVLADEQSTVLDAVRRTRGRAGADHVLPDAAAHGLPYAEAAIEDLVTAAAAGAEFATDETTDRSAPKVDDLASQLADELTGPLRIRLERCFEGLDDDEDELTNLIRSCYREWRAQRIVEVTRHFVLAAFTRGQYQTLPTDTRLQWVVDSSGPACPDAEDNALAGALAKGENFPTGHCMPPAHAGCRCLIVPALVSVTPGG